MNTHTVINSF